MRKWAVRRSSRMTAPAAATPAAKTTKNSHFWATVGSSKSIQASRKRSKTAAADWSPWRRRERRRRGRRRLRQRRRRRSPGPPTPTTTPKRWPKTKNETRFTWKRWWAPRRHKARALSPSPAPRPCSTIAWRRRDHWPSEKAAAQEVCCSTSTRGCKLRSTARALHRPRRPSNSLCPRCPSCPSRPTRISSPRAGRCPGAFPIRPSDALLCTLTWPNRFCPRSLLSSSLR